MFKDWFSKSEDAQPAPFQPLDTEALLNEALARSHQEPVVIFKHSNRCGVSSMARGNLLALDAPSDPPVYELVIQRARALSNALADRFGIRHESPQVILLYHGAPVFDTSHGGVNADAVRRAARTATAPTS